MKYVYCDINDGDSGNSVGGETEQETEQETTVGTADQNSEPSILKSATFDQENIQLANFPAKYTVKNEDGTVNIEETAKKLNEGYSHLAKKMGETGGLLPDNPEDYKIEFDAKSLGLPDNISPELLKKDNEFKEFVSKAHKAGFTNEQINLVAGEYLQAVQSVFDQKMEDDKTAAQKILSETWKTPAELNHNLASARKAFEYFASDEEKSQIDSIGNNPIMISLLAKIGNTMREDSSIMQTQSSESRDSISSLMMSEAYSDEKHPDHKRVYNQVSKYYRDTVGEEIVY